jgi:hypothetical protein
MLLACLVSGNKIGFYFSFGHFWLFGTVTPNYTYNIAPTANRDSHYEFRFYELSSGT